MIVPMKKVTLLVLDSEKDNALTVLGRAGVLHVEKREGTSQKLIDLQAQIVRIDQAQSLLADFKIPANKRNMPVQGREKTLDLIDRIFSIRDERHLALERVIYLENELERLSVWGAVTPDSFKFLSERGIHLVPFVLTADDYASLPPNLSVLFLKKDKKTVRCVIVGENTQFRSMMPQGARELTIPLISTAEMARELAENKTRLPHINARLAAEAVYSESLTSLKATLLKELEFETVRSGMQKVSITGSGDTTQEAQIAVLSGFLPGVQESMLAETARKNGWAMLSQEPAEEEAVPTLLKNNRFVNLISPLLDFLGITPGYREQDISVWFLLYFGIFFAMIFGDGGYGGLLVCLSLAGILLAIRKGKTVSTGLYMLLYLGLMTVVWGTMTCTWFGIPTGKLPVFLKSLAIPAFASFNQETSPTNIKIFCFVLGLTQLSLAHIIGIFRNIRSLKMLGELGSLLMTAGMFFVVLNLVVDAEKYPITALILAMIGTGFLLNFLFINYSRSVVGGIIESLKNSITMFLGVVNVFGDIMSYIRLWAVGLAGSAISSTVNSMAGPMFGGALLFAGMLLLLFGHGLNYIMSVLSVIVHGVRLNTLEFSNHLGLTWSGFKYEPFTETVNK
jgi:V/A-type H+-transporting ATPase subunit I